MIQINCRRNNQVLWSRLQQETYHSHDKLEMNTNDEPLSSDDIDGDVLLHVHVEGADRLLDQRVSEGHLEEPERGIRSRNGD